MKLITILNEVLHGGIAGSVGCIDLVNNIDEFANYFSTWKIKTKNDKINIVVKY